MTLETLLKLPGFLYEVNGHYYYLGKWICKECTEIEATDCVSMYHMCRNGQEEPDTAMYFQKSVRSVISRWRFLITQLRFRQIYPIF